jgi:hypothetical protein
MKNEDLKKKEIEKLERQFTAIKIITGALIGVLTLLFIVSIYGLIVKENNSIFMALIVVAISLCAVLPLLFVTMKNIKNKLNMRTENN